MIVSPNIRVTVPKPSVALKGSEKVKHLCKGVLGDRGGVPRHAGRTVLVLFWILKQICTGYFQSV